MDEVMNNIEVPVSFDISDEVVRCMDKMAKRLDTQGDVLKAALGRINALVRLTGGMPLEQSTPRPGELAVLHEGPVLIDLISRMKDGVEALQGLHPNVLQVDEADLFKEAQFDGIANALESGGKYDRRLDVLSTNYSVAGDGVILKQVEKYENWNKQLLPGVKPAAVYRICLIDLLERCPEVFKCFDESTGQHCPLWAYCKGKAKEGDGFYKVTAALETQRDSSRPTFESQMLLMRPSSEHSYFPSFSMATHVLDNLPYDPTLATYFGVDLGGSRCPHAAVVVQRTDQGVYRVVDEFTAMGNIEHLLDRVKARYPDATDWSTMIDPKGLGKADNYAGALSYASVFRREGFHPRAKQFKRKETFDWLARLIEPASGPPKFLVAKRCTGLIRQVQAAEHVVVRGHMVDEPADGRDDDLLDALRFVIGFTYGRKDNFNRSSRNSIVFF